MRPLAIILADGESKGSHLQDRYFIEIGGEELLPRTVRQFSEWADVCVVSSNPSVIQGVSDVLVHSAPEPVANYYGADMIRKGLAFCGRDRNIIVFGDVYFTDDAVQAIQVGNNREWAVYGRSGASEATGAPWAEYFAIEIASELAEVRAWESLFNIANYYTQRDWPVCTAWEWYYEMEDLPFWRKTDRVRTGKHWVEIDDATDDIDLIEDVERIRKNVAAA